MIPLPSPDLHRKSGALRSPLMRGQVWHVRASNQEPSVGTELWSNRPAVIVSGNTGLNRRGFVQVVYLTSSTKKRSGPDHVPVSHNDKECLALCEQIHTVDNSRLAYQTGELSASDMDNINAALKLSLGLPDHCDVKNLFYKWENYIKKYGLDVHKEIEALCERTTDEHIRALQYELESVTRDRDAYATLYENMKARL